MYLDSKTDRLVGTCKVDRYLKLDELTVEKDQEVDLLICNPTEIGINVIINDIHKGLLYDNELFQAVSPGERIRGYIKNIRPDNKIDVSIQKQGYESIEPNAERILQKLKDNGGHLNITDKTDPVIILARLEMSKKVFKKALGLLYKQKLVVLDKDSTRLASVEAPKKSLEAPKKAKEASEKSWDSPKKNWEAPKKSVEVPKKAKEEIENNWEAPKKTIEGPIELIDAPKKNERPIWPED